MKTATSSTKYIRMLTIKTWGTASMKHINSQPLSTTAINNEGML